MKLSNKGKYLMIFNDKSGSMSGQPWNALQEATRSFADILYPEGQEPVFEDIKLIYFESVCHVKLCLDKASYLDFCNSTRNGGGTSFQRCFDAVKQGFPSRPGSLAIVFLTDGQGRGDVGAFKEFLA